MVTVHASPGLAHVLPGKRFRGNFAAWLGLSMFLITGNSAFCQAPSISLQPLSQTVLVGSNVTIGVTASGGAFLSYQWRFNTTNFLASQTNATLTLSNVSSNQTGSYDVVVTNTAGAVTSRVARLAAIVPTKLWTGNGDGQSWSNAQNWSGSTIPTEADDIYIGGSGTITNLPPDLKVKNLLCRRNLAVTGGLTVIDGVAQITGSLYVAPESYIEADGTNGRLVATGPVTAYAGRLYVDGGALQLPGLISYSAGTGYGALDWAAISNGVIDLPALGWLEGGGGVAPNSVDIYVVDGGRIDFGGLTNISAGRVHFHAEGSPSSINFPALISATGPGWLKANSGGKINAGQLTELTGLSLEVYSGGTMVLTNLSGIVSDGDDGGFGFVQVLADGGGTVLDLSSVHELEGNGTNYLFQVKASGGGSIKLGGVAEVESRLPGFSAESGGSIDLSGLKTARGTDRIYLYGGTILAGQLTNLVGVGMILYPNSTLVLTNLQRYAGGDSADSYITARSGAALDLSSIKRMEGDPSWHTDVIVRAERDAQVNLSGLVNVPTGKVHFNAGTPPDGPNPADGEGSSINLSSLKSFSGPGTLTAEPGGTIFGNQLTNLVGVTVQAWGGSSIHLANLKHISGGTNMGSHTIETAGENTVLDLSSVISMDGCVPGESLDVKARYGASVNLSGLTNIPHGVLTFLAEGEDSLINLTALQVFNGPGSLTQSDGGVILLSTNLTLSGVDRYLAPFILVPPQNSAVLAGSPATFSAQAIGNAPLAYQWFFNETNLIAGATNSTLILPIAGFANAGTYQVKVTNQFDDAISDPALLQVVQPLTVTTLGHGSVAKSPVLNRYDIGQSVTLSATPGPYYQFARWADGGTNSSRLVTVNSSNNFYTAIFTNSVTLEFHVLKQWERDLGGSGMEGEFTVNIDALDQVSIQQTADGGYILGGSSSSPSSGSKISTNYGGYDMWIVKLDAFGNTQWERAFGGVSDDWCTCLQQTSDGGYIIGGYSDSGASGNKASTTYGYGDYWVVRLDPAGNKVWDRTFGGSDDYDFCTSLTQATDGGFLIAGRSLSSPSGNKTSTNFGMADIWAIRLDAAGNKLWDQSFGGSNVDTCQSVQQTVDGGFILAGSSYSPVGGNKASTNFGSADYWMIRLDAYGNKLWDQSYGGVGFDLLLNSVSDPQSQTYLTGFAGVIGGGNQTAPYHGDLDFWVVKAGANGSKIWDRSFGGTNEERAYALALAPEGGLSIGGYSKSGIGGDKTTPAYGGCDGWLVGADTNGIKTWDFSFGGTNDDWLTDLKSTTDGGLIAAGFSASGISGNKTTPNYGSNDFVVVKLARVEIPVGAPVVLVNGLYSISNSFAIPATNAVLVSLQTTFTNANLFYTLDGSDPDFASAQYDGTPFSVMESKVVRAIAYSFDYSIGPIEADPVTIAIVPIYNLTNTTPGGGSATFNPPGGVYLSNTVVIATAAASNGWTFMGWQGLSSSTNNPLAVTIDRSTNLTAVFGTTITSTTNGTTGASVALSPTNGPYAFGSTVRFIAVPPAAKSFARWFNPGTGPTNNPLNFVVTNNNPIASAFFVNLAATNFTLTTLLNGFGTVTRNPAANFYPSNSAVQLTAVPDAGYVFVGWSGATNGTASSIGVVLNTNKTITANFAPESNAAPAVVLTGPADGAAFVAPASILLTASASDGDGGVSRVEFYSGNNLIAAVTNQPYQFTWTNVAAGAYVLRAQAVDNYGARATSAPPVGITVSSPTPIVVITSPTNGSDFITPTNVTITANAIDSDGFIAVVRFFAGTNLLGIVTNASPANFYSLVWSNVPNGVYLITAEATDNTGGSSVSPVTSINAHSAGPVRPTLHLGAAAYQVNENVGQVLMTVVKDGVGPAAVNFSTVDGTAHYTGDGLSDYARTNGSLVFGVNEFSKTIAIAIGDDFFDEPNETFSFALSEPDAGSDLGTPSSAVITILASDAGADTNSLLRLQYPTPTVLSHLGSIRITLTGADGRGQWRFPWETTWRNSGTAATGLVPGENYPVEYRPLAGFIVPNSELVPVLPDTETPIVRTNFATFTATGNLQVQLEPAAFTNAYGFAWRLSGETNWHLSGESLVLPEGRHAVEFKEVNYLVRPVSQLVDVFANGESVVSATYLAAQDFSGTPELPRPLNSYYDIDAGFSSVPRRPWAYNGQLVTSAGNASGFAVHERVVVTAAHVVFDDATRTLVPQVDWFPQRQAGEFEPLPIHARGWYIMPGYITQRLQDWTNGYTPGESTPQSEALDVAVLFFDEPVVRGGYGGFLVSTATSNWIAQATQTMLTGYPTEDPLGRISPGKLHWLEVFAANFTQVVPGVFETSRFLSFPGNSGGPVLVPARRSPEDPITYYPAGIYLGNSASKARVRVIDTNVLAFINLAASTAALGSNFNGGGPINPFGAGTGNLAVAKVKLLIGPPEALAAGGGWRIKNQTSYSNYTSAASATVPMVVGNTYYIDFLDVPGFTTPSFSGMNVPAMQTTTLNFNYTPTTPMWLRYLWPAHRVELYGPTGIQFQVETSSIVGPNAQWRTLTTLTLSNSPTLLPATPTNDRSLFFRGKKTGP